MSRVVGVIFALLTFSSSLLADFGEPYGYRWQRTYVPLVGTGKIFNDLYLLPDGGIAYCGTINVDRNTNNGWLLIAGEDGNVVRQIVFNAGGNLARRRSVESLSLIQTDDGGYLVGGKTDADQSMFGVIKVSPQGNIQWWNSYATQARVGPCCYGVIELKEGDYVACGEGLGGNGVIGTAMAVRINPNGAVVWQRYYQGTALYGVREIEDGLAFISGSPGTGGSFVITTTYDGVIVNSKRIGAGIAYSLIRSPDAGFIVSGQGPNRSYGLETDSRFNVNWRSMIDLSPVAVPVVQNGYCVAKNFDGNLIVGNMILPQIGSVATEVFLDRNGNPIWGKAARPTAAGVLRTGFHSVVTAPDGSFIACGGSTEGCIAVAYEPVAHKPYFVELTPSDSLPGALVGDTVSFMAIARDPDDDEIIYTWRVGDEVVGQDSSVGIQFPEEGFFRVVCIISDGEFSDSTYWRVKATNLYISEHSPDTLNLRIRRNTEHSFSVTARGSLQEPYVYRWWMADPLQEGPIIISEESRASYLFQYGGMHVLSATVWQGDNRDDMTWRILVDAALARWYPVTSNLNAYLDSSITFGVVPVDSEALDWQIRWIYDDQRIGGRRTETVLFDTLGVHTLLARIVQNEMVDTVRWQITVTEYIPDGVKDQTLFPKEFSYSVSPNPFNEVTQIHINLPDAAEVKVSLYDSFGRYVKQIDSRAMSSGRNKVSFDAAGLPAGVYILRLDAGTHHGMTKAVLMR